MNASTIVFTLAKLNQSTKYMLKVAKEMLAKSKSSEFNFTYKVTPFLAFVVAIKLDISNIINPSVQKNLFEIKLFDFLLLSFNKRFY